MDFRDTPEEAAFRKELRDWLERNLPPERRSGDALRRIDTHRWWQRTLFDGGWAGVSWPKEYGGRGAGIIEQAIFYEEMATARAPQPINLIGMYMAGPTIIAHGADEQKRRYLPKILSGEEIWCQGFSEPGAGSDLAALRTSAVPDGDDFVVNGQKVWTSYAHYSDFCNLLVRTDFDAPKHKGLSYLLVDMRSPGIEVRPLKQMSGDAEFNEVFFSDVRVPKANLLGDLNDGWRVAVTTLMHERGSWGVSISVEAQIQMLDLVELAKKVMRNGRPAIEDPVVRQEIGRLYTEISSLRLNNMRALAAITRTGIPGPEGSISKLVWSESSKRVTDLAAEILGPAALLDPSSAPPEIGEWIHSHLQYRSTTIGGGTSEVLRNVIAERVLGLPAHK